MFQAGNAHDVQELEVTPPKTCVHFSNIMYRSLFVIRIYFKMQMPIQSPSGAPMKLFHQEDGMGSATRWLK